MTKKKWLMTEEMPHCPQYFVADVLFRMVRERESMPRHIITESIVEYENGTSRWRLRDDESQALADSVFEAVLNKEKWAPQSNHEIREKSDALFEFADELPQDCSRFQDDKLAAFFDSFTDAMLACQQTGMPSFFMEYRDLLTNRLLDCIRKGLPEAAPGEVLSVLTTPLEHTKLKQSELAMLELACESEKNAAFKKAALEAHKGEEEKTLEAFPAISKALDELHARFSWISYVYEGPPKPRRAFAEELVSLVASGEAAKKLDAARQPGLAERQKRLLDELCADDKHRYLFEYARGIVFLKGHRKDAIYYAFYKAEPLFKDAAKRLEISLEELHALAGWEISEFLHGKPVSRDHVDALRRHRVTHMTRSSLKVMVGEEAKEFIDKELAGEKEAVADVSELRGTCASPGNARGTVKIVSTQHDMHKVEKGDVLVAPYTNPDLVPAMKKACAIVTDQGGLTSHAAIVSRELGVPCVVGVRTASRALKDGDVVEVDASHGTVKKL